MIYIRLPNICFDKNYNLIWIDLDVSDSNPPEEAENNKQIWTKKITKDLIKNLKG